MMKDNLKFRVLDVQENTYCDLNRRDVMFFINPDGELKQVVDLGPSETEPGVRQIFENTLPKVNFKVEFCTGLKDRHEKLIYQGDIIRCYYSTPDGDDYEDMEVRYDEKNLCWVAYDKIYNFSDATIFAEDEFEQKNIEIVGNINTGVIYEGN